MSDSPDPGALQKLSFLPTKPSRAAFEHLSQDSIPSGYGDHTALPTALRQESVETPTVYSPRACLAQWRKTRACLELDHRFDHPRLGPGPFGELIDGLSELSPVSYPRGSIDPPGFDGQNDVGKVVGSRVPAGQDSQFAPVKVRVIEGHLTLNQPDEDEPAAVGGIVECTHHGSGVAGGVENYRWEIAAGNRSQSVEHILAGRVNHKRHAQAFLAEFEPLLVDVQHDHLCSCLLGKLRHRQPDRAGSDDEHDFARLHPGTLHGMAADSKRFNQGQLIERQGARHMQLATRHNDFLAHPAIDVDTECLQTDATVRFVPATGDAAPAIDIRFNRTKIARFQAPAGVAHLNHLHTKLVAENTQIAKEGLV